MKRSAPVPGRSNGLTPKDSSENPKTFAGLTLLCPGTDTLRRSIGEHVWRKLLKDYKPTDW